MVKEENKASRIGSMILKGITMLVTLIVMFVIWDVAVKSTLFGGLVVSVIMVNPTFITISLSYLYFVFTLLFFKYVYNVFTSDSK